MSDWHLPEDPPSEEVLFFEIAELEERVSELGEPHDWRGRALLAVYESRIQHRRKLLAAVRDGRPELWKQYAIRTEPGPKSAAR